MLGGGVKMQKKAPVHIITSKANIALLTTEEHRTAALLQRIEMKLATLEEENEKNEFAKKISNYNNKFASIHAMLDTIPGMHGLNAPILRDNLNIPATPVQRSKIPERAKVPLYKNQNLQNSVRRTPFPYQRSRHQTSWYRTQVEQKPLRKTPSLYQNLIVYDEKKHRNTDAPDADQAHKQWHQRLKKGSTKFVSGNVIGGNSKEEVEFFLVLCEGRGSTEWGGHSVARQVRQARVLLKSAVLFSRKRLHFHVIADSTDLFKRLVNQTVGWPDGFKKKIRFTMHDVWYPEGKEGMRSMFRACATERLFVPEMFPAMDKAVYIDTDVIFMRPPEDLWSFFDDFSPSHIAAMAGGGGDFYRSEKNKVPYYGERGLNSGILLMHLDRMRAIPGWWLGTTIAIHDEYKERTRVGDQDILNILFSFHPEKLYDLPCEWNYYHCKQGVNDCQGAQQNGVSILHGNGMAFVKGHEMKLQTIFELFEQFQLGADSTEQLYRQIVAKLWKVEQEDLPGKCKAVAGIDRILLGEMEKHLSS